MLAQIFGVLRAIVPALLAWAVARGWLPQAFVDAVGDKILDAVVALVTVIAAVWSFYKNRPAAVIAHAATLRDVDKIIVNNPALLGGKVRRH